ncbi:MAG TPA: hypothetical protein VFH43_11285 [Candidatus Kapabacteria bacterium]|nr:hypothetical protein [Candidatus Kapabacteria bacterium]
MSQFSAPFRAGKVLALLCFSLYVTASMYGAWHLPANNPDMIFYVAAVHDRAGATAEATYTLTYEDLRGGV